MSLMINNRCRLALSILVNRSACSGCGARALHQVGEANDGVHRRADLVAHVGQKGALGHVGGFGLLPCGGQFRACAAPPDPPGDCGAWSSSSPMRFFSVMSSFTAT
jgi:hypothetical protein